MEFVLLSRPKHVRSSAPVSLPGEPRASGRSWVRATPSAPQGNDTQVQFGEIGSIELASKTEMVINDAASSSKATAPSMR